jgi:hypothetical protein
MDTKSGLRDVPSRGYPREGTSLFYLNKMVYFWIETLVYFPIEINTHNAMPIRRYNRASKISIRAIRI